jgi:hypothetical protein
LHVDFEGWVACEQQNWQGQHGGHVGLQHLAKAIQRKHGRLIPERGGVVSSAKQRGQQQQFNSMPRPLSASTAVPSLANISLMFCAETTQWSHPWLTSVISSLANIKRARMS